MIDRIVLERHGCGRSDCPDYVLEVFPDGVVVYNGRGGADVLGQHIGQVDPGDAQALFARATDALAVLEAGPEVLAFDSERMSITVVQDDEPRLYVYDDMGALDASGIAVWDLGLEVDAVAGVAQLVGPEPRGEALSPATRTARSVRCVAVGAAPVSIVGHAAAASRSAAAAKTGTSTTAR